MRSGSSSRPWRDLASTFISPAGVFEDYLRPGESGAGWSEQDAATFVSASEFHESRRESRDLSQKRGRGDFKFKDWSY